MIMRYSATPILLVGLLASVTSVNAQTPVTIPDSPTCPQCRITADVLLTLGTVDGPGSLSGRGLPAVDAHGRLWIAQGSVQPPLVFDERGRFVQALGGKGPGPNEYLAVSMIIPVAGGDSMLVFDAGARRAAVVDMNFKAVRHILTPAPISDVIVIEWPRHVLVASNIRNGDVSLPIHDVNFAGPSPSINASYPTNDGIVLPDRRSVTLQLADARGDRIWAVEQREYHIERRNRSGLIDARFLRGGPWFRDSPPGTGKLVTGLREDSSGRLWTFIMTPRPGASEEIMAWVTESRSNAQQGLPVRPMPREVDTFGTTIEVLDVERGRVIARDALDYLILPSPSGNRAFAYSEHGGIPRIHVVELNLRVP